ncbi:hypothetical protein FD755_014862 [Muntiacus reevesi]|uniref:G kinase-anchoring protein 1 n=1 Tax=Muntiacus reevesi TaxID=9886 RepID=A0A5N3XHL0_MUNRE|nr:hypothetical protein FD755_014862 [Muntiacus reevesi]
MASAVLSSVPTTASRFALLQVDSGSGSDSEPGKGKGRNTGKSQTNKSTTNEKKREKRRKKKEQQQSEANELRNLAFKKIPQKSSHAICNVQHELSLSNPVQKDSREENWQEWRQRDEQLTSEMFEADLEKALLLSKLEYEEHKKELSSSQTLSHDGGFFNRLEDDVHKILTREKRREQLTEYNGTDNYTAHEYNQKNLRELQEQWPRKIIFELEFKRVEFEHAESAFCNCSLLSIFLNFSLKNKTIFCSSVHGILQARILRWVSCIAGGLYHLSHQESPQLHWHSL